MNTKQTRAIDHLVLPVDDLGSARTRLTALGFILAPEGIHPFGTRNANINFQDGTFLEPLAIGDRARYDAALAAGNSFVRGDNEFRSTEAHPGFSHIVMSTEDAAADDVHFKDIGFSGGDPVDFSRVFETPDGAQHKASFGLAFASVPGVPAAHFFTCQRIDVPVVDRSAFTRHANGAMGIKRVISLAANPTDFSPFLRQLLRSDKVDFTEQGIDIDASNGTISVLTDVAANEFFGGLLKDMRHALRHVGFVLAVDDLKRTARVLEANGVEHVMHAGRLVIQPAPGQRAVIAFEEQE